MRQKNSYTPTAIILGDMRDLHHHGCEAVTQALIAGLVQQGFEISLVIPGLMWEQYRDSCLNADLVVINGEGALHHSRPSVNMVLCLAELRKNLCRPTALVNTSWFENSPDLTQRLTAFDIVTVRESRSRNEISEHAPVPMLVPDMAILYAMDQSITVEQSQQSMISDSTTSSLTKKLRKLALLRYWEYLPVLARPLKARSGKKSIKIYRMTKVALSLGFLAPWLLSPRYHAHAIGEVETLSYLKRLALCNGVVTGRFHTVCFAIALGIPFLAISSNTPKIEALLESVSLDAGTRMVDASHLFQIKKIPPFSEDELDALDKFKAQAILARSTFFTLLRGLVS